MTQTLLKFFSIADITGVPLIVLKLDDDLDESLIGGFLAAIYHFANESLRNKVATISIRSLNARMESYFYDKDLRYPLIACGLLVETVPSEIFRKFAEEQLSLFVASYGNKLSDSEAHIHEYESFENYLRKNIQKCFSNEYLLFEKKLDRIFEQLSSGDLQGLDEI